MPLENKAPAPGTGSVKALRPNGAKLHSADSERASSFSFDLPELSRLATIGIFIVVAIAALKYGRSIVMPVLAALILATTLRPLQRYGAKLHIPAPVSTALILLVFCGVIFLGVSLLSAPVSDWAARAPDIGIAIRQKLARLDQPLDAFRELSKALGGNGSAAGMNIEGGLASLAQQALGILTPAVTEFIVFFGTLIFVMIGGEHLRRQTVKSVHSREGRLRSLRVWSAIEKNLIGYLGTVTMINIGLGIVSGAMLYAIGFPSPIAFGVLIFCLNYIPYVGPAIFALVLFAIGLIAMPTLGGALLAPGLFIAIATVEGHFITPSIIGHRLTLSPFLVFLSVAFWTWMWGPFGTFLATPLLIVAMVLMEHMRVKSEPLP
jgi:predicted PurR-regulated permease PerM